ncbi:hypothetical protein ACFLQ0_06070 [Nitrospinota bacterium]
MKKLLAVLGLVMAGIFAFSLTSSAQPERGWGRGRGWGQAPYMRPGPMHFDTSTLQTLTGKVVSFETVAGFGPRTMKVLKLESEGKTQAILLGPEFYLTGQKFSVKKGDSVAVVASPAINRTDVSHVAKSVTVNGKTLQFRDEAGIPAWRRGAGGRFGRYGYGGGGMRGGRGWGRRMGPGRGFGYGPAYMAPPCQY